MNQQRLVQSSLLSRRFSPSGKLATMASLPPPPQPLWNRISTPKRVRVVKKMGAGLVISSLPVLVWWKWAVDQRHTKLEEVRTKVRVPNVQTIDDLMIEKCRPGDVLLFDRRWEHCAAGPMAALVCMLGRSLLCNPKDPSKVLADGQFDHCGAYLYGSKKFVTHQQDVISAADDC